jgi:hypothetical protein
MPYLIAPRLWIRKLIDIGLLPKERRHDAAAAAAALHVLRERSQRFLAR